MKRDADLIRQILIALEDDNDWVAGMDAFRGLGNRDVVLGHLKMMEDAAIVDVHRTASGAATGWRMTWQGYEFLDTVRDPEIWRKTKAGATKIGSWSIKLIGELATGYLKAKAASLGLPIS